MCASDYSPWTPGPARKYHATAAITIAMSTIHRTARFRRCGATCISATGVLAFVVPTGFRSPCAVTSEQQRRERESGTGYSRTEKAGTGSGTAGGSMPGPDAAVAVTRFPVPDPDPAVAV